MTNNSQVLTAAQLRGARAMLKMQQRELARRSGVPLDTLRRFETREGLAGARYDKVQALRAVLEAEGIVFTADGVRLPER